MAAERVIERPPGLSPGGRPLGERSTVAGDTAGDTAGDAGPARTWWGRFWHLVSRLKLIGPALNARIRLRRATSRGARVTLRGRPKVVNQGKMTIGDRVRLDSTVATLELVSLPGGHLEIGDNVFINYGSSLVAASHVRIGNGCLIGTHVMVMDSDFHRVEDKAWDTTGRPIILEERVWLGNRSIVLKGVTIGHDAVVAAGSVVTRNVPPRTVVAGVPARVVRRF
jgi:acetyltransferase-like isoleucine patch superfamily enzyme